MTARTGLLGQSCDYVWARRTRRSFRLLVAASILLTGTLWFSEGYLRYDQSETQYRMALTLHPAQARPILRTVVARETELNEVPPSLYLEALALVEEPDKVLDAYEQAYLANPRNTSLVTNYGCFLYFDGQYEEARERFREAGVNPPRNALPRYLEAAALAAMLESDADLSDLVALITRANVSGDPVLFPEPLWHASLPTRGKRYVQLRRHIADQISIPLLQCAAVIFSRAEAGMERGDLGDWDNWLEKVQFMGARLMGQKEGDTPPTMVQVNTALHIQQQALKLRGEWSRLSGGVFSPEINNALLRIQESLEAIEYFEAAREPLILRHYARLILPIQLVLKTALLFFAIYAVGLIFHQVGSGGKRVRAVPHVWAGKIPPFIGLSVLFLLLIYLMLFSGRLVTPFESVIPVLWFGFVGLLLLVGVLYPWILFRGGGLNTETLTVDEADNDADQPTQTSISLRRYLGVYGCLFRRYMGVLAGGLIILVCTWLIMHRIALTAYPFQLELFTTGLENEAAVLIDEIQEHLGELTF